MSKAIGYQLYFFIFIQEVFDKVQRHSHPLNRSKQAKIMSPYDFYSKLLLNDPPFPFFIAVLAIAHAIYYLFLLLFFEYELELVFSLPLLKLD